MKKEMKFLVTLSLLAMTAMTDASSSSIPLIVQPGPVAVKQGNDVTLWCKVKLDTETVAPVLWQSPLSFRTITTNCDSHFKDKYDISCGESSGWYNITIKNVGWADMGRYRCFDTESTGKGIVDLKVFETDGAYSGNDIEVQPGPVKVKQGNSVNLWCKLKYDSEKVVPVNWQSPPNFKTRTSNCEPFDSVKHKYAMSCSDTKNPFGYYNLTIMDVVWKDTGEYRCLYTRHKAIVDLQVLVPVAKVSLTYVSNSASKNPLFLSKGVDAALICTTSCAYPAPNISWFENDQPFKGIPIVNITESDCREDPEETPAGLTRTISTVTVTGKYVDKNSRKASISCMAENVIGEEKVFSRIAIEYDDPCEMVWCPSGGVCEVTSQNHGVCVCGPPDRCNGHHKQVCGDDGIMYPSQCELHRTACIKDKHIGVDHTNIKCIHLVTTSPPQITKGVIVAAVVVPILVVAAITVSIIVLVRRKCRRRKEMMKLRRMLEVVDVWSAPPLGRSETTETEPQPVVIADLVDVRCGSGDSEHNTESQ